MQKIVKYNIILAFVAILFCGTLVDCVAIEKTYPVGGNAYGIWDAATQTFTIKITGKYPDYWTMDNWDSSSSVPWYDIQAEIRHIVIEDGLKNIGSHAFDSCSKLQTVRIPDSVSRIGQYAFFKCEQLSEIALPVSMTTVENHTFSLCTSLMTVDLPYGMQAIETSAFLGCSSLKTLDLPETIKSIGKSAFENAGLTTIHIPCATLGDYAFHLLKDLEDLSFGANFQKMGKLCFAGCPKLKQVTFPEGTASLGAEAFNGCASLEAAYFLGKLPTFEHQIYPGYPVPPPFTFDGTASNFKIYYSDPALKLTEYYGYPAEYHEHVYTVKKTLKDVTCVEAGLTEQICTQCGTSSVATINSPLKSFHAIDVNPITTTFSVTFNNEYSGGNLILATYSEKGQMLNSIEIPYQNTATTVTIENKDNPAGNIHLFYLAANTCTPKCHQSIV